MTLSNREKAAVGVAVGVTSIVAAPFVFVGAVGMIGFGSGGIVAGSWAASIMATYGGTVAAGSACAILQSVGAAGLGAAGTAAACAVGGLTAGGAAAVALRGDGGEDGNKGGDGEGNKAGDGEGNKAGDGEGNKGGDGDGIESDRGPGEKELKEAKEIKKSNGTRVGKKTTIVSHIEPVNIKETSTIGVEVTDIGTFGRTVTSDVAFR